MLVQPMEVKATFCFGKGSGPVPLCDSLTHSFTPPGLENKSKAEHYKTLFSILVKRFFFSILGLISVITNSSSRATGIVVFSPVTRPRLFDVCIDNNINPNVSRFVPRQHFKG